MTAPDPDLDGLDIRLAGEIRDLVAKGVTVGEVRGLNKAADYIEAQIREAHIIGEAKAILLITRDQIRLIATQLDPN